MPAMCPISTREFMRGSEETDFRHAPSWLGRPWDAPLRSAAAVALGQGPEPQRIEADEPFRVLRVVGASVVFEGHEGRRVERLGAFPPDHDGVAIVELEAHVA